MSSALEQTLQVRHRCAMEGLFPADGVVPWERDMSLYMFQYSSIYSLYIARWRYITGQFGDQHNVQMKYAIVRM